MQIPEYYSKKIIDFMGDKGKEWINNLPTYLYQVAGKWDVQLLHPFPNLSYNFALLAQKKNGDKVVLKAWIPEGEDFATEVESLKIYNGDGISKLLDVDVEKRILLLEFVHPGNLLLGVHNDEEATRIAASVMKRLWKKAPERHGFLTINDWWERAYKKHIDHFGGSGPIPQNLFKKAGNIFKKYVTTQAEPVLLHGDLQHFNILKSERDGWLAIDPQGVIGEPVYETGAFLRNPLPGLLKINDVPNILKRRIEIFEEELGFPKERIHGWAFAQAVLSAMWDLDFNSIEKANYFIEYARMLDGLEAN